MANHKSAKKRIRQNLKTREWNRTVRTAVRTSVKKVRSAVEQGELDKAQALLKDAEKDIQRAAGHGKIHPKNASRKISRLHAFVRSAKSAAA